MIEVFGVRVRQARLLRRMTAKSVVEAAGWSPARQSQIEKAQIIRLDDADVELLSGLFRFPEEFFTAEPQTRVSAAELLFRAPKSMTVGEQDFLATFASLAGDFLTDLDGRSKLPPVKIPTIGPEELTRRSIAAAAARLRAAMGVDHDEPLDDLMYEAERLGAPVIVRRRVAGEWESEFAASPAPARDEKHLGYSSWVGRMRDRPLIVLRDSDSWERTRFTIAHELGHLVLHSHAYCSVSPADELEANRFATELLAPAAVIADELPRLLSLLNLRPLKDKWGLSLGSLIMHLRDSRLIPADRAKALTTQLHSRINPATGHTWGMTEPGFDDRVPERPRLLRKWVERCYGGASVPMLAAREAMIYPADVLDWFLATQRPAPASERQPVAASVGAVRAPSPVAAQPSRVVRLDDFRKGRPR
ncbi:ImmA/IrrE family metallo-endopeptidase [Mycobacteroides abscessus subsp. abscessus]|jgi:Zn-dependent peptidase ImmA (M78 family)/transcriptional regulator with XRE-family HTH domain|uniref:ImmA/IrrE family metallo-endopeptidase n=1 Tax=Mycobacteroides abscessus TaxID=36809 RepID=UPI00266B79FE|nr:ImmA/IrrE family metallo-endopeptidase [Mycobacteroides abscessus]MDO3013292.1 ImmA/IrrE family metallo-endopeptidase [Mycobacteroides abscessus subsp. abscessus]